MSERSGRLIGLWLLIFIVFKAGEHTYIATWSWWWLLLPVVPCLAGLLHGLGIF